MTDSNIIYAFVVTVAGSLISVAAGIIAVYKSRASATKLRPVVSSKPGLTVVLPPRFYAGGDPKPAKPLWLQQPLSNSHYVVNSNIVIIRRGQKPTGRLV